MIFSRTLQSLVFYISLGGSVLLKLLNEQKINNSVFVCLRESEEWDIQMKNRLTNTCSHLAK